MSERNKIDGQNSSILALVGKLTQVVNPNLNWYTIVVEIKRIYTKACKNQYNPTKLYKHVEYVWTQACMHVSSTTASLPRGGRLAGGMAGDVGRP
jgi:hypothetical protein